MLSYADTIRQTNASSGVITSTYEAKVPEGLEFSPKELYFGALVVGEDQLIRTFTVTNVGKKTLRISGVRLEGAAQFTMTGTPPPTIKPGESFEMSVRYFSTMPGLFSGYVEVDTTEDRAPYYIGLSGRVVGSLYLEETAAGFTAAVNQEAYARATADEAEAGQRLQLKATLEDTIESEITQERTARVENDNALASDISTMSVRVDAVSASVLDEIIVRANADTAIIQRVTVLEATVGDPVDSVARAAIAAEQQVRADADSAEAENRILLEAELRGEIGDSNTQLNAAIEAESQARVTGLAAEASQRTQLETSLRNETNQNLSAAINTEANARVTGDQAEATARNTLAATLRLETGQKITAAVNTEAATRADADSVNASAIQTVQTNLGGQIAAVSTASTANYNSINGRFNSSWSATLTANGLVGGFKLNNDGQSVSANFDVDTFSIGKTAANSRKPFVLTDGVVYMNEAIIQTIQFGKLTDAGGTFVVQNGRLQAQYIFAVNLAALSANLGHISTGNISIQSDNVGGWGYLRSNTKWWGDGQTGWVLGRAPNDEVLVDMQAGSNRIWMSSWNDCGIQFPGILMTNGGLTISQLNVIGSANIAGGAISTVAAVSGSAQTITVGINIPAGETWRLCTTACENSYQYETGTNPINDSHPLYAGLWNGSFYDYVYAQVLETAIGRPSGQDDSVYTTYSPATALAIVLTVAGPAYAVVAMQGRANTTKTLYVTCLRK